MPDERAFGDMTVQEAFMAALQDPSSWNTLAYVWLTEYGHELLKESRLLTRDNEALKRAVKEAKTDRDTLREMLRRVLDAPDTLPAEALLALRMAAKDLLAAHPYESPPAAADAVSLRDKAGLEDLGA